MAYEDRIMFTKAKLFCGLPGMGVEWMLKAPVEELVEKWLPGRQVCFVHKARTAIRHACEMLKLQPGDEILAPAYNCGTEIDALRSCGIRVVPYRIDRSTNIDIEDIIRRVTEKIRLARPGKPKQVG